MSATKHIIHDLVLTNEPVGHILTQAINFGHVTRLQLCFCSPIIASDTSLLVSQTSFLRQLSFFFCDGEIDETIGSIARWMPQLQTLSLEGCSNLTDIGMDAIVTLSLLNTLKLDHCNQITSRGFEVLSSLRDLSTLSLTNIKASNNHYRFSVTCRVSR
jgi:hypothetical protein